MVILGGLGTLYGGLLGSAAYLIAEEWLSGITENWKVIFGPILVLVVSVRARRTDRAPAPACGRRFADA